MRGRSPSANLVGDSALPLLKSVEEHLAPLVHGEPGAGGPTKLGPYALLQRIGQGGMAEVFLAKRALSEGEEDFERVALKCLLGELNRQPRFVRMFREESTIMARLRHANLVRVFEFGEEAGQHYMVQEYIDGISCAKLIRAVAARGQRFPLPIACYIVGEVLKGLSYAHRYRDAEGHELGLVHRDVSPGNILISRWGEVKLTDFGIQTASKSLRDTLPGEIKGKPGYMSPEQACGERLDSRSDLFTLSIVFAEMLTARPLFSGKNEAELLSKIRSADLTNLVQAAPLLPAQVVELLKRGLALEPLKRFSHAAEFREKIIRMQAELGLSADRDALLAWLLKLDVLPAQSGVRRRVLPEVEPCQAPLGMAGVYAGGDGERLALGPMPALARLSHAEGAAPAAEVRMEDAPGSLNYPVETDLVGANQVQLLREGERPITLQITQLLALIATGRVEASTPVAFAGEERPLAAHPQLKCFVARAEGCFQAPDSNPAWEIHVRGASLLSRLFELVISRSSGMLEVESGNTVKRVYLRAGRVVKVMSSSRRELIGTTWLTSGRVDAAALEQALYQSVLSGRRLGEQLLIDGALSAEELNEALSKQAEQRLLELGRWRRGAARYYPELTPFGMETLGPIALSGGAAHPEAADADFWVELALSGFSSNEISQLLAPHLGRAITRAHDIQAERLLREVQRPEVLVLEFAAPNASLSGLVAQLLHRDIANEEQAWRAIFLGLCAGWLSFADV